MTDNEATLFYSLAEIIRWRPPSTIKLGNPSTLASIHAENRIELCMRDGSVAVTLLRRGDKTLSELGVDDSSNYTIHVISGPGVRDASAKIVEPQAERMIDI